MTENTGDLPRVSKSGGERSPRRGRTKIKSPTSQSMLDPDRINPDQPTQLVLDPKDHEENVIKPLLALRPTARRVEIVHEAIKAAGFSKSHQPNPLERRTR